MINLQNTGINLVKSYMAQTHHDKNIENLYKVYDCACNHSKSVIKYVERRLLPSSEFTKTKTKMKYKNEEDSNEKRSDNELYKKANNTRMLLYDYSNCESCRDLQGNDSKDFGDSRNTSRVSSRDGSCNLSVKPSLPYLSLCHDFVNRRSSLDYIQHHYPRQTMSIKERKIFSRKPADLLWLFLRKLLDAEQHNTERCIEWTNRSAGEFRIVKTNVLASLWGQAKNNRSMTYDKMARAMRFNYKQGIIQKVANKKLHYSFGEKILSRYREES